MLATFISDLKNSPYYDRLIFRDDILCLYVGGSNSVGTFDSNSDFDLVAITLSGESFDASQEVYLKYKGKKVHWYYWSIKDIFKLYTDCVWLAGIIYFKNIRQELIIYLNTNYQKLWDLLLQYRDAISRLACYQLFYSHEDKISTVLAKKDLLAIPPHKSMYHLCLATSYLLKEPIDIELLCDLKLICRQPLKPTTNKSALEIISRGLHYVQTFPVDIKVELEKLYMDFCEKASLLNLREVEL